MDIKRIKLSTLTYLLVSLTLMGYLMVIGRGILIPLTAGVFFAMILYPLCRWLEGLVKSRIVTILLSELLVFGAFLGLFYFFSQQVSVFFGELDRLLEVIPNLIDAVVQWVAVTFNLDAETAKSWTTTISGQAFDQLAGSFNVPSILLTTIGLLPIYSFLLLLYRSAFRQFLLIQVSGDKREKVTQLIRQVLSIAQGYIYGLGIVILILAILNSTGLWLIGIPYPLLWGFLAAFLAIIPYIGTFLGGLLPFLSAYHPLHRNVFRRLITLPLCAHKPQHGLAAGNGSGFICGCSAIRGQFNYSTCHRLPSKTKPVSRHHRLVCFWCYLGLDRVDCRTAGNGHDPAVHDVYTLRAARSALAGEQYWP